MRRKLRDNSLSLVMFLLFAFALLGQSLTGHHAYNQQQRDHHQPQVSYLSYLRTGHFVEAVFENWESEFLQMAVYVLVTALFFQRGSAESKDPDKKENVDEEPGEAMQQDSPRPVWKGGLVLKVYQNSLSLALFGLFLLSFLLHAAGGAKEYSNEQLAHGGQASGLWAFLGTSQFWFQSFQNWQSEFFSIGALVVLSIYLRQKGSPESKPVAAAHEQTGESG